MIWNIIEADLDRCSDALLRFEAVKLSSRCCVVFNVFGSNGQSLLRCFFFKWSVAQLFEYSVGLVQILYILLKCSVAVAHFYILLKLSLAVAQFLTRLLWRN